MQHGATFAITAIALALVIKGAAAYSVAAKAAAKAFISPITAHALRLSPGDDLVQSLVEHAAANKIGAASVLMCVGSLTTITLRMAAAEKIITLTEPLEIISLQGTVCDHSGDHHLHCSVSRRDGSVIGGHCKGPATIATTAEVVLGVMPALKFVREMDAATNYKELQIQRIAGPLQ